MFPRYTCYTGFFFFSYTVLWFVFFLLTIRSQGNGIGLQEEILKGSPVVVNTAMSFTLQHLKVGLLFQEKSLGQRPKPLEKASATLF